jgi:hypothetical protein
MARPFFQRVPDNQKVSEIKFQVFLHVLEAQVSVCAPKSKRKEEDKNTQINQVFHRSSFVP